MGEKGVEVPPLEVRGVRLGDVFRDEHGELWEVRALCTEPQAVVVRVHDGHRAELVIGCRLWEQKWSEGPLR